MSTNNNFQSRKKILINDYNHNQLKTENVPEGSKYPATGFFELANNGKIYFKVNDGNYDPKNRNKEINLQADDRNSIFNLIRLAATSKDFETAVYEVTKHEFIFSGGRSKLSENPIVVASFSVAKDKRGVILLRYTKGDYKQLFAFTKPNHSKLLVKKDGTMVESTEIMSSIYAKGWCDRMETYLNRLEEDNYQPPVPKDKKSNNFSNSNSNSSPSYNDSYDDDDDINF